MSKLSLTNFLIVSLIVISSQNIAHADIVSLDANYVAGQTDVTTKLNNDRTALVNGVNNVRGVYAGGIQSSGQIKADTIGEENMADDANPRIRTNEGASCPDFVASGLLPSTSASLVLTIPTGVAYPDGYRVEKTSSTGANLTASKWTYYYILTSGSFATNEVTIGGSTPSSPANSAVLFRASSDATTINTITDLRKTSCAAGPFSSIADAAGEATLADMFSVGVDNRRFSPAGTTPEGWVRGLHVSLDATTTQFLVTKGSAYINGKYRFISQDVTVPSTADLPSDGISGLDSGSVVSDTTYYVYAVGDVSESRNLSVTYSTSPTGPAGVTNYRLIGRIGTNSSSRFASSSTVYTAHALSSGEYVGGWINFQGTGTVQIKGSRNVSALADNGTGDFTVTWDRDFSDSNYVLSGIVGNGATGNHGFMRQAQVASPIAAGSSRIDVIRNDGTTQIDTESVMLVAVGGQE